MSLLDKHAPKKQRHIRANNVNFMTKSLREAIMLRSKFRNRFLKEKTEECKSLYNKQRNICVKLLRKIKMNYYAQLDNKIFTDNRKFWKAVNPLKYIILKEHGKTITDNKKNS